MVVEVEEELVSFFRRIFFDEVCLIFWLIFSFMNGIVENGSDVGWVPASRY